MNEEKKKTKKEIGAGIIVFRRTPDGIRYLLLYKSNYYWNFPRGTVESEEKSFEAALRETNEETGLTIKDLKLYGNFKAYQRFGFRRHGQAMFKIVILYLAETRKHDVHLSSEHQGFAWLSYREAVRFLSRFRGSEVPLRKANDFLTRKPVILQNEEKKA